MSSFSERLAYLGFAARHFLSPARRRCPSCGDSGSLPVDRKYCVTTLRRCLACRLLFRAPTSTPVEQAAFYQSCYQEGFTTELPSGPELRSLLDCAFRGTGRDYGVYMDVLEALGGVPGQRLLDYGCSWGYGSWQLSRRGFNVDAIEISVPRAEFARRELGVKVLNSPPESGAYDIFFSAHVLEHVHSVGEVIELGTRALRPGGLFVAATPNGSAAFRRVNPGAWHRLWGYVHPNLLDADYYEARLTGRTYLLASSPYPMDAIATWRAEGSNRSLALEGEELLAVFRKP